MATETIFLTYPDWSKRFDSNTGETNMQVGYLVNEKSDQLHSLVKDSLWCKRIT